MVIGKNLTRIGEDPPPRFARERAGSHIIPLPWCHPCGLWSLVWSWVLGPGSWVLGPGVLGTGLLVVFKGDHPDRRGPCRAMSGHVGPCRTRSHNFFRIQFSVFSRTSSWTPSGRQKSPKCSQNRSENRSKIVPDSLRRRGCKEASNLDRFGDDFSSIF